MKVYIKTDTDNSIYDINNEIHIKDFTDWILIDDGEEHKHYYAKNSYLEKPIFDHIEEKYNYKYVNKQIVEA